MKCLWFSKSMVIKILNGNEMGVPQDILFF
jgi:hypothetical protein